MPRKPMSEELRLELEALATDISAAELRLRRVRCQESDLRLDNRLTGEQWALLRRLRGEG